MTAPLVAKGCIRGWRLTCLRVACRYWNLELKVLSRNGGLDSRRERFLRLCGPRGLP